MMKKYKLHTNPSGYDMSAYYQDIVNAWNDNANILDGLGYKATMADVGLVYSSEVPNRQFVAVAANEAIASVWEMFDYEPDERTIKAIMENEPIRHAIDKKAQKARNFCRNMYERVGGHPTASCSFWEDCGAFEMVGNRIICQDDAAQLILEYFTTYTVDNKQNKIYEQLQKVEEQLVKLNECLDTNSEQLIVRDWRTGGYKVNYENVRYM
jgi:hypothetical protein